MGECSLGDAGGDQSCSMVRACKNGQTLQSCSLSSGGACESQYYDVGSSSFACTACGDCASALAAANAACP
jgi:hypothetical protein